MKILFIILTLFLASSLPSMGQMSGSPIEMTKKFGSYQFYQNGHKLKVAQVAHIMKPNDVAYSHMRKAKFLYDINTVIGITGGALIGWPIGTSIAGGEPNWLLMGIGAGLIATFIPLDIIANKNAKRAVNSFN